jgi:hypothetical protein
MSANTQSVSIDDIENINNAYISMYGRELLKGWSSLSSDTKQEIFARDNQRICAIYSYATGKL